MLEIYESQVNLMWHYENLILHLNGKNLFRNKSFLETEERVCESVFCRIYHRSPYAFDHMKTLHHSFLTHCSFRASVLWSGNVLVLELGQRSLVNFMQKILLCDKQSFLSSSVRAHHVTN